MSGVAAERVVHDRLPTALPAEYRPYPDAPWLTRTADHRGLRDGEADLVLTHPERGILVFEVNARASRLASWACKSASKREAAAVWNLGPSPSRLDVCSLIHVSMPRSAIS